MAEMRNTYKIFVRKPEGKKEFWKLMQRQKKNGQAMSS
jgi:hypothetical protein